MGIFKGRRKKEEGRRLNKEGALAKIAKIAKRGAKGALSCALLRDTGCDGWQRQGRRAKQISTFFSVYFSFIMGAPQSRQ